MPPCAGTFFTQEISNNGNIQDIHAKRLPGGRLPDTGDGIKSADLDESEDKALKIVSSKTAAA